MNHTYHINHIYVVYVKCTTSYGGGKRGSCEPQKHMNQKWVHHAFFVVYVNHKNTWWTLLWFM